MKHGVIETNLAAQDLGMTPDALTAALERARVVAVLDGWAEQALPGVRSHKSISGAGAPAFACVLRWNEFQDEACRVFYEATPDAARAAAARAIESGEV